MNFPSDENLRKMRDRLEKAQSSHTLSSNANSADRIKYKICEKFVAYILNNKIDQIELAKQLQIDPAQINEIIKYRIDLFTVDKLIEFAERLDPKFKMEIA